MSTTTNPRTMAELVELMGDKLVPFVQGDVLDVTVLSTSKESIMVDVAGVATVSSPKKSSPPKQQN
jgi:hypothetical protein